jgi:hypothetical protein
MIGLYWSGGASDELGDNDKAGARFEEMLRFWAAPDIELEEITDARARLARLRS